MMDVEETFPILEGVELPPAKGVAPRPKKSDRDPIQTEKRVSLETSRDSRDSMTLGGCSLPHR